MALTANKWENVLLQHRHISPNFSSPSNPTVNVTTTLGEEEGLVARVKLLGTEFQFDLNAATTGRGRSYNRLHILGLEPFLNLKWIIETIPQFENVFTFSSVINETTQQAPPLINRIQFTFPPGSNDNPDIYVISQLTPITSERRLYAALTV